MKKDEFEVEILEDGTIKMMSSSFSAPMHMTAEKFRARVLLLAGGEARVEKLAHSHTHEHEHEHEKAKI